MLAIYITLNSNFMSSIEEAVKHLQIPLQELSDATNGFSELNVIASGGFGKVYKGLSEKHGTMAIKMLDPLLGQGNHEFRTEIALLSVYKHENIVSLVGFCDEDGKKILVYKYESHGSLNRHLKRKDLTWIQRLQICLDAARGLQYLHDDVGDQHRIIHRDIKSANILLDDNWKAKIADFGLCKEATASFVITNGCGTVGYIDPDYNTTGYLTQKSDVYSFGVVLFEVLCGRLARDPKNREGYELLTTLIKTHWKRKTINEVIHPGLQKKIKKASLLTFSRISYQCLMSGNERPTMKKVVELLQRALDNQLAPSGSLSDDGDSNVHIGGQRGLLASSSQSRPASSSWTWKYDAFLSFTGEDTSNIVDLLYRVLHNRQIITYKDDGRLPMGESIAPLHFKAIQESRIAIIIFSRNYASSFRCLDELALIMKNRKERGQLVIPVFYDVQPSEVRKQTGHYVEVFSRHELENNINKVESWREAFTSTGNLAGWDLHTMVKSDELNTLMKICKDISRTLTKLIEASASTGHIGIETRMHELKSLLEVGSGGVHMVGICGMWGSGKSTLASSIYKEISLEFDACCFVENVSAESRMHGLKTLQEKILSDVLNSKVILRSIKQGISMMSTILCQNSVLIVLDDVDHIDHLKMLAGSKTWFGDGSRIIIKPRPG